VVDPSAQPKFCKACTVPYFLREKELNRLVDEGTLDVENSLGVCCSEVESRCTIAIRSSSG